MATNFSTRYKKDLSTEALKTKLARRKSVLQKESRYKEFNRGRQFGPIDVNTQASRDLSRLEETKEDHSPKGKAKLTHLDQTSKTTAKMQQRMEMLQRYKVEKELRKLKDQREKPVFKCGRFNPDAPAFLPKASQIPVLIRPKGTVVKTATVEAPPVRVTRSMMKNQAQDPVRPQLSLTGPSKGSIPQIPQQKQIYVDKLPRREKKEVPAVMSTASNGRFTRAAAAVAKTKIPQLSRSTTTTGNSAQKKETNKGKQHRGVKKEEAVVLHKMEEIPVTDPVKGEESPQLAEETAQDEASFEKENLLDSHTTVSMPPRRTRSFAPQNFVFKPQAGLATYKVEPMSPSKADGFMTRNLTWSPMKNISEVTKEDAKEAGSKVCDLNYKFFPSLELTEDVTREHQLKLELPAVETEPVPEEVMEMVPSLQLTGSCTSPIAEPTKEEAQRDVPYFRNILHSETERLSTRCLEWDGMAETDIPEDAKDLVRTTIGQTRLLIAERFKQFEGLVDNCEFQHGEKETTCTDLDGFWDMVNFQVEDVNKKFENLRRLQENGWQMVDDVQAKKPCKKKAAPQKATKASGGAATERAAARKRLASIKAAMKSKMKQEDAAVGQGAPVEEEKVVFDGGFFQVESPAKVLSGWTPKSAGRTPRPMMRTTPRSAMKGLLQSCAETCVLRHGTPTTTKAIAPLPDLVAWVEPCGASLLGSISEQSDAQATEVPCVTTENMLEEAAADTQLAVCDKESSGDQNVLFSVNLDETVEDPNVRKDVSEASEEMEQSDEPVNEQDIFCSPRRDSQSENQPFQEGIQQTSDSLLLSDLSCEEMPCGSGTPDRQPEWECSLFFTPPGNKTEQLMAAAACNNLMSFSPRTVPEEGK